MRSIEIIGAASGLGAQDSGCADGPAALAQAGLLQRVIGSGRKAVWSETLHPISGAGKIDGLTELCARLAASVCRTHLDGKLPLVVGGDHACAIGTWSGLRRALAPHRLGLIWVDAHMDSHTPRTTPSGALHGMPLACLLGHGVPALCNLGGPAPQILPHQACLIGVRSYEPGEAILLGRLGVRVFHMDEIERRGVSAIFEEALAIVERDTAAFGISIDLDALDPRDEPGVGSPAADGLRGQELVAGLRLLRGKTNLAALELMEYNPHRDRRNHTAQTAISLAEAVLGER